MKKKLSGKKKGFEVIDLTKRSNVVSFKKIKKLQKTKNLKKEKEFDKLLKKKKLKILKKEKKEKKKLKKKKKLIKKKDKDIIDLTNEENTKENSIQKPLKIINCQEIDNEIHFEVEWQKLPNSKKPSKSWISTFELRKIDPCLMIRYYETKLKFIKKIYK